jgi:V8-like Glu-specific endopeptidase
MAGDPITTFPGNSVVLIESPDPSGDGVILQGSGVVIGPHTILTASHVVYDISEQTPIQNIEVIPSLE